MEKAFYNCASFDDFNINVKAQNTPPSHVQPDSLIKIVPVWAASIIHYRWKATNRRGDQDENIEL